MLEIASISALIAFVYAVILTQRDEILFAWGQWLSKITYNQQKEKNHWIYRIIVYCEKCIAGQLCLWWFLIKNFHTYSASIFIYHIATISLGIFLTIILKKIYNICQR